jgi:hypothetical protein
MTENVVTENADGKAEEKKSENPLRDYEDDELEAELKRRGYFVFDEDTADDPCSVCVERQEDVELEKIHYLIANGKHADAIEKMRDYIDDAIGRRSA